MPSIDSNGFGGSSARTPHRMGVFRRSLEGMSQFCQWLLRFIAKASAPLNQCRWEPEKIDRLMERSCRDAREHNLDEGLQCSLTLFNAHSQNGAFIGIEQKSGQFIRLEILAN